MRFRWITAIVMLLLIGRSDGWSQSFVNLGFDNAIFTTNYYPGGQNYSATVPGWINSPVSYNDLAFDAPAVTLHAEAEMYLGETILYYYPELLLPNNVLGYALVLQGGTVSGGHVSGTNGASISQIGQIPIGTKTMTYRAPNGKYLGGALLVGSLTPLRGAVGDSPLQVTFNGNLLSFFVMLNESSASEIVWGANISDYAGLTGELRFTTPWLTSGIVSDITFSSSVIPEPGSFGLFALSGLLLVSRRRRLK